MKIAALRIIDGLASLITVRDALGGSIGLNLEVLGLDPRGSNTFDSAPEFPEGTLTTLVVTPSPATILPDSTFQMTAFGYDEFGTPLAVTPVWTIVEGGILASIADETGIITTTETVESFTVRATVGALTADASVTVSGAALDSIAISPNSGADTWTLSVNQTQTFTAVGYIDGSPVSISPVWSVEGALGFINASTGFFEASTVSGTTVIRATVGPVTQDLTVTINMGDVVRIEIIDEPTGAITTPFQLTVVGYDIYDNALTTFPSPSTLWEIFDGGTLDNQTQNTADVYPSAVAVQTSYPDAVTVTWNTLSDTISFTVDPN